MYTDANPGQASRRLQFSETATVWTVPARGGKEAVREVEQKWIWEDLRGGNDLRG